MKYKISYLDEVITFVKKEFNKLLRRTARVLPRTMVESYSYIHNVLHSHLSCTSFGTRLMLHEHLTSPINILNNYYYPYLVGIINSTSSNQQAWTFNLRFLFFPFLSSCVCTINRSLSSAACEVRSSSANIQVSRAGESWTSSMILDERVNYPSSSLTAVLQPLLWWWLVLIPASGCCASCYAPMLVMRCSVERISGVEVWSQVVSANLIVTKFSLTERHPALRTRTFRLSRFPMRVSSSLEKIWRELAKIVNRCQHLYISTGASNIQSTIWKRLLSAWSHSCFAP